MGDVEILGILLGAVSVGLGIVAILFSVRVARAATRQTMDVHRTAEAARVGVEAAIERLQLVVHEVSEALNVYRVERKTATLEDFIAEWLAASSGKTVRMTVGSLRDAVGRSRFHLIDLGRDLERLQARSSIVLHGPAGDPNTKIELRFPPG